MQCRRIVGIDLHTLADGAEREVVLPVEVIGLGEIKLCVSVGGKNADAMLEQLQGFFFLAGGQSVDADFEQEVSVVWRELKCLFISRRRFGGVS